MASLEVHPRFSATAGLLLLAAIATPCAGFAQRDPTDDLLGAIAERITEAQARGGPYSTELIDPLKSLSVVYEENGNHSLASAVLEQAMQVIRANYGLRSLEQAPLLQQRIRSEERRGDFATAWELEQDLLTLARRQRDDLAAAPILHEIGDKRMDLLKDYLDGGIPPQIALGCYYQGPRALASSVAQDGFGSCNSGQKDIAAGTILIEAQMLYAQAVGVFLRQEAYSSAELRELESKLIHSSYAYGGASGRRDGGRGSYQIGRRSLSRLVSYGAANEEPLTRRIDSVIQVADWDLLFDQRPPAIELYKEIYAFLEQRGVARAAIDEWFSPETPHMLPTFAANPSAAARAQTATGYVDIAFEITYFGTARHVDVVSSTNASKDARSDFVRLVSRGRFRPIVKDGEFVRSAPVVVRYYVEESSPPTVHD